LPEFQKLVDHRSVEDLATAIQRIQKCNAISLAADNRRKMQVFYNVLLQYFASVAGEKSLSTQRLNVMVKPLIELSGETPYFAALCARERIVQRQHQLSEKLRSTGGIICWPSTRTLLLLRLWSLIFPPSDFRHAVMTPAMLLMSEYLLRCPVTSARDVAIGSFICSLLLSVMVLSVTSGFFGQKYSLNWATNIFVLPFSVNDIMFLDNVLALDNVLFVDDSFSNPCAYSVCFLLARVNHM
jgi:nucleolar protein 14